MFGDVLWSNPDSIFNNFYFKKYFLSNDDGNEEDNNSKVNDDNFVEKMLEDLMQQEMPIPITNEKITYLPPHTDKCVIPNTEGVTKCSSEQIEQIRKKCKGFSQISASAQASLENKGTGIVNTKPVPYKNATIVNDHPYPSTTSDDIVIKSPNMSFEQNSSNSKEEENMDDMMYLYNAINSLNAE